MNHYLIATQQSWGVKAFGLIAEHDEDKQWTLVCDLTSLRNALQIYQPRFAFFVNWSDFVTPDILALSEPVNFHCTPLPFGRGGGPIENLLLRGFTETVITAHRMVEALDAGPIYGQRGPISLAGTKGQILDRFVEPCVDLIRWIIETEPEPYPQVGEVVTFKRLPRAEFEKFWRERT